MKATKKAADTVTWARAAIGAGLIWLGWQFGARALAAAAWLMLADWIGDVLDGMLARSAQPYQTTWIGEHDLEIDIFVSLGLSVYLWQAGFIPANILGGYLIAWLAVFLLSGFHRALGMLFQAPVYGLLIHEALQHAPFAGWSIIAGLALLIIITWPRFPEQVVPGFLAGILDTMQDIGRWRGA